MYEIQISMFIDIYWNKKYIYVRYIAQILFKRPSETKKNSHKYKFLKRNLHNRKLWHHIHVRAYKHTCKDQLEISWLKKMHRMSEFEKKEMVSVGSGVSCRRVKRIFMTGWAKSMPVASATRQSASSLTLITTHHGWCLHQPGFNEVKPLAQDYQSTMTTIQIEPCPAIKATFLSTQSPHSNQSFSVRSSNRNTYAPLILHPLLVELSYRGLTIKKAQNPRGRRIGQVK